jgi:MYXO-CTERM domain-containing protein
LAAWLVIAILTIAATPAARAQAALGFSGLGSSYYQDTGSRMLGWQFSVLTPVSVTDIGWFDWAQDGLSLSKQVGIWDTSDQSLVASVTLPSGTGTTLAGHFRYVTLGSPVGLLSGHTYRIAGYDVGSGGDPHVWDAFLGGYSGVEVTSFTADSRISLATGEAIGHFAGGFGYPTTLIGDARQVEMGPNMILAAIPEPPAAALAAAGMGLVLAMRKRRRQ